MEQHLPKIYLAFREAHPEVATALDELGRATEPRSTDLIDELAGSVLFG